MNVIGLMSGTSVDGIDAALVSITGTDFNLEVKLIAKETYTYPTALRESILAVCEGASLSIAELAALDDEIASQFALAAVKIQTGNPNAQLIGSHGQTVYHRPPEQQTGKALTLPSLGYSMQLGRGEVIAYLTEISVISNFRAADIAALGQGAPLVPKVDAYLLSHPSKARAIQNLGGIGNVTYLPARKEPDWQEKIIGWDTGPSNTLLDLAVKKLTNGSQTYDRDGNWAARGTVHRQLVDRWLEHDFFKKAPPKSTGRELFGEAYLKERALEAQQAQLSEADWLATIAELTVASIAHSYRHFLPSLPDEILLCGGGSRNLYIRKRLQQEFGSIPVMTTDDVGVDGDFKEAIAFAVLAYWRYVCLQAGNLPQVTGAKKPMLLGDIHEVPSGQGLGIRRERCKLTPE
jgi:anhydro-N-acetylmuramic acid kinase